MLATASLGAIWSSCSPDFGERGVLDRFGQIEPKVFIASDGYWYAGKRIQIGDKLAEIVAELPGVAARGRSSPISARPARWPPRLPKARHARRGFLAPFAAAAASPSRGCPSRTPLYILYLLRHDRRAEVHRPLAPAARCCSTSRSTGCTATSAPATACSTSPPAAG